MDYGFRVVISSRFADIFRGNSGKAGLLAAQVGQDTVEQLWKLIEEDPTTPVVVDLEERSIQAGPLTAPVRIDDYPRYRLLNGADDDRLSSEQPPGGEECRFRWSPSD